MRNKLLQVILLAMATAALAFTITRAPESKNEYPDFKEQKLRSIIRCSPDWETLKDWLEETDIPPIPGSGTYTWKISTTHDSAQFYFNQGINMYYSFHIIESMASFKKAEKFDPECAMIHWAQALAYGPNINDLGYAASPDALQATQKAVKYSVNANKLEKALIEAMQVRYTADSADTNRKMLNEAYTEKMKAAREKHPAHPDVNALYADAMMLEHPWDLWKPDGTPKPWTPKIREVLEILLKLDPDHPGGNHYYIHVMEPSPYFAEALPSADRLGITNPGLSHVVHMPSHIFLRAGQYQKGVDVNTNAVKSYEKVLSIYSPVAANDFIYVIHNLHMKANNAMMAGQYKTAKQASEATQKNVPEDYLAMPGALGSYMQYLHYTPVLNYIRFGKWDELLRVPIPDKDLVYASLLVHFGRGMAYTAKKDFDNAGKELDKLRAFMSDDILKEPLAPFSAAIEGATVAEYLLLGYIHLKRKMYDGAIRHFSIAAETEENMVYNEPRDWLLNPKHWLGQAYLEKGDGKNAEKVFLADLKNNNENGWALTGLYQSLLIQKKNQEAADVQVRFKKAFEKADIKISSAVQ